MIYFRIMHRIISLQLLLLSFVRSSVSKKGKKETSTSHIRAQILLWILRECNQNRLGVGSQFGLTKQEMHKKSYTTFSSKSWWLQGSLRSMSTYQGISRNHIQHTYIRISLEKILYRRFHVWQHRFALFFRKSWFRCTNANISSISPFIHFIGGFLEHLGVVFIVSRHFVIIVAIVSIVVGAFYAILEGTFIFFPPFILWFSFSKRICSHSTLSFGFNFEWRHSLDFCHQ